MSSQNFLEIKRKILFDYFSNSKENLLELDKKLIQMITLNVAVLGFLMLDSNIKIPIDNIYGLAFYILTLSITFGNISILLYNYIPKQFPIIDVQSIEENEIRTSKNYTVFNKELGESLTKTSKVMDNICKKKSFWIKISYSILAFEFILISILKLIQSFV